MLDWKASVCWQLPIKPIIETMARGASEVHSCPDLNGWREVELVSYDPVPLTSSTGTLRGYAYLAIFKRPIVT